MFHTKETQQGQGSRYQTQRYCGQISNLIENFLPGCQNVQSILHARVPIIKYTQEFLGLECDLSFATTGYHMSELLYIYGELDNRVRPLISVIRCWAKEQNLVLNESPTPYFTNFMLTLMTIFFLQNRYKMLPSFNELQKLADPIKDKYVCEDGVVCSYARDISGLQPKLNSHWKWQPNVNISNSLYKSVGITQDAFEPMSLKQMLMDFFKFYAEFEYQRGSICVRTGQIQPKNHNKSPKVNHRVSSFLEIVNPLEPELNVSSNVQQRAVDRFRKQCKASAKKLEKLQHSDTCEFVKSKSFSKLFSIFSVDNYEQLKPMGLFTTYVKDNKYVDKNENTEIHIQNELTAEKDSKYVDETEDIETHIENEQECEKDSSLTNSICSSTTHVTERTLFKKSVKEIFEGDTHSNQDFSFRENSINNEHVGVQNLNISRPFSPSSNPLPYMGLISPSSNPLAHNELLKKNIKKSIQDAVQGNLNTDTDRIVDIDKDSLSDKFIQKTPKKKKRSESRNANNTLKNFFQTKR